MERPISETVLQTTTGGLVGSHVDALGGRRLRLLSITVGAMQVLATV